MPRFSSRRLVASILTSSLLLQANHAFAIGLLQAYQDALANDPAYHSAIYDNDAGRENRAIGRSNLLPNLGVSYSGSRNRADVTVPSVIGPFTTQPQYISNVTALTLRQPIINFDGIARYRQGQAQANYSDAQFSARKEDLILRLVGAYADAKYAEDQLALMQAQRDAFDEQMRVNEFMFKKGEGTKTDMIETQAKLDLAEAQLIESRDNLTVMRQSLAAIIGHDVDRLDGLSNDFRVKPLQPATFEEWKTTALAQNPELAALRYSVDAAEQEVKKNRAGHLPHMDFIASFSRNKSDTINTYNQDATIRSVGVQLNVPLYSGGYVSAATSQAEASYKKAQSDLEARRNDILVDLHKQYSAVLSGVSKIAALVKSVDSATLQVDATRKSIKGGMRINLDLLNAQQQLYTARRDLAQARYNYLVAYVRLRNAAGLLNEEDVHNVAGYFVSQR